MSQVVAANMNEVSKALVAASLDTSIRKAGVFKILEWKGDKAFRAAQRLLKKTDPEYRDDDFWAQYYGHCKNVHTRPNIGVTRGLHTFLQQAVGFAAFSSPAASTDGVFGGPASGTGMNKGFTGVGNGLVSTTLNGALTAGATSIVLTSGTNFAANDWIYLTDSTTSQQVGSNPEYVQVASISTNTVTPVQPIRFAHSTLTYAIRAGAPGSADLPGVASGSTSSKAYRAIDASYPTESAVNSKATLTWQTTYATAEAQFAWNEALIGAVASANTPPATATATFPATPTAIVLASSVWMPSPLTKGATAVSLQYQLSVS